MYGLSLGAVDDRLERFLTNVVDSLKSELEENLLAVLLHGSLAMGSFYPPKSDVDLLVIVQSLTAEQACQLYNLLDRHHACRPYAGALEVSVVRIEDTRLPKHPLPYLVHFSETTVGWRPWQSGKLPTDEDLIAHLTVAKYRGRSLYGLTPDVAIGELQWADYLASVCGDIDWILEGENILDSPFYCVLNLCRWAMITETADRIVPGKEEAGIWAMKRMSGEQRDVIAQALAAYRSGNWPSTIEERKLSGGPWHETSLLKFRDHMRTQYEQWKSDSPLYL